MGEGNVCTCTDNDKDGSCDDVDCDDSDATVHP